VTHPWAAETVVDEGLARRVLARVSGLEVRTLRRLAEGWDRDVWLLNEEFAVAFPRRQVGVPGIERELRVLPRLAPLLPLPVSGPVFVAPPGPHFQWPVAASRYLAGVELWQAELSLADWRAVAAELGAFLRVLHGPEPLAAVGADLPVDPNSRMDMSLRVPKTREALARVDELGIWRAPASANVLLAEAERLTPTDRLGVCHGDLHPRHVLVENGRISGVIDWNDACRADPALDLSLLWSAVPVEARAAFFEVYGACAPDQELRARVVALSLCAYLAEQAHDEGNDAFLEPLVRGLVRAAGS
jgi:aminoglycoside phosphotransferase (APT) family kinase protein